MAEREDSLTRPLTYSSATIVERRERMLREAWKLIAEYGMEGFSVRQLAERSEVSQGTFYNAFGTKENAVALAVTEYASTVIGGDFTYPQSTLDGRMERLVRLHARILPQRRYIAATMTVFWSDSLSPAAKAAMSEAATSTNTPYVLWLQRRRGLSPYISPERLTNQLMIWHYGLLSYWGAGGVADADLVKRAAEEFLLILAGATRGAPAREVEAWRDEVATEGARWRDLIALAEKAGPLDLLA